MAISFYSPYFVAEVGFAVDDQCSVRIFCGLFAIRRSDTTNDAMFAPDFCGVWILSVSMCFFRLFFSHNYDFPSPQNRFKGPKAVRLKPNRNSHKRKKKAQPQWLCFFQCVRAIKKIFLPFCLRDLNSRAHQLFYFFASSVLKN